LCPAIIERFENTAILNDLYRVVDGAGLPQAQGGQPRGVAPTRITLMNCYSLDNDLGLLYSLKKIYKALGMFALVKNAFYQIGTLSINGQENSKVIPKTDNIFCLSVDNRIYQMV